MAGIASDAGLEALALSDAGSAARITLNRPDKRNALSLELMDEPDAGAEDPRRAADVRAMVVGDREGAKARHTATAHPPGRLRADLLSDGETRVGNQITAR